MRNGSVAYIVMLTVLATSPVEVVAQVCTPNAEKNFTFAYLQSQLEDAGYRCEAASLVRALTDPRERIARTAAGVLAYFSPTPEVLAGLRRATAASPSNGVAVSAATSLLTLGPPGWEDGFVQRFWQMDDLDSLKVTAAGILAQTGRTEGWPFIEAILRTPIERGRRGTRIGHALQEAMHFDGLRDVGGQVIDTVAWAEATLVRARAVGMPEIEALEQQVELVKRHRADRLSR